MKKKNNIRRIYNKNGNLVKTERTNLLNWRKELYKLKTIKALLETFVDQSCCIQLYNLPQIKNSVDRKRMTTI